VAWCPLIAPQNFYLIQLKEVLVGAVGIEPTTFGLKVRVSSLRSFGINELHSGCLVELRLFGLVRDVFRTFSVPPEGRTQGRGFLRNAAHPQVM
jgi:hypothetical protein